MISGKNYIGSELTAKGSQTYNTFNPNANQDTEWQFFEANEDEINSAVKKATQAFKAFSKIPGKERAVFLSAIADEIEALGDELIETYVLESGLPEGRARGERGRTIGQLKSFANLLDEGSWVEASIDTAKPERQPIPKVDIRKMIVPLGPIAVFGSSNFPLAFSTAGGDTASALAAGCPVIVKSHPMHAATGELVASAIIKAAQKTGMPEGVFSNLNSSGIEVGKKLVMHPGIKGVGFTGSIKGGTALYHLANSRDEPIPVFAEMGSINPVVVLSSALKESASTWAQKYAGSITLGAGQFCTNPGLLIGIDSEQLNNFSTSLKTEIEKLDPSCMLHPNIHQNFEKGKYELSDQEGVEVVAEFTDDVKDNFGKQKVLSVSGSTFLENPKLHQEVFGPFSIVVKCSDYNELVAVVSSLEGQLTGTILGSKEELEGQPEIYETLQDKVGRLILNGVPTGVEVCPSMHHGGPFPASSDSRFTSVGTSAIKRWVRPVSFQSWPQNLLPAELKDENPLQIMRLVNGVYTKASIG